MDTLNLNFEVLKNTEVLKAALIQLEKEGNEYIGWLETESIAYGILNGYYGTYEDAAVTIYGEPNDYIQEISELIKEL